MTTTKPSITTRETKKPRKPRANKAKQDPQKKLREALKSAAGEELFTKATGGDTAASNELRRRATSGDAAKFFGIAKACSLRSVKAEHQLREALGISESNHKAFLELLKTWK